MIPPTVFRFTLFGVRMPDWRVLLLLGLLFPQFSSVGEAAFFLRSEGQFLILQKEVSYRRDLAPNATIEQVMAVNAGWVAQSEKPFPLTLDPSTSGSDSTCLRCKRPARSCLIRVRGRPWTITLSATANSWITNEPARWCPCPDGPPKSP